MSSFQEDCLKQINDIRRKHSAEALKIKEELNKHAQRLAEIIAQTGQIRSSNDGKFGENIAVLAKPSPTAEDVTKEWYKQANQYDFGKPGPSPQTSQFTQMVWKSTTHMGVGKAEGPNGTAVVAKFSPMGNVVNPGMYEQNVLPQQNTVATIPTTAAKQPNGPEMSSYSSTTTPDTQVQVIKAKNADEETETTIATNVKIYVDPNGRNVKETKKAITTVTIKNGRKTTTTQNEINTEYEKPDKVTVHEAK